MTIEIDEQSGFCFGVVNAIRKAEKELQKGTPLYCLGDIVHNTSEVHRLEKEGMKTIDYKALNSLREAKVLFRAHGEPPATYEVARKQGLNIVDATCPVVLNLQKSIRQTYEKHQGEDRQLVIFGKKGHAEVNGLVGQTNGEAIVIETIEEADSLNYTKPIELFSQTTKPLADFQKLTATIEGRMANGVAFVFHDTICRQVALRLPHIAEFAQRHDYIYFIAGKKSSNGKALFAECLKANPKSFFISHPDEITLAELPSSHSDSLSIGICGATSTPRYQMEEAKEKLIYLLNQKENPLKADH